LINLFWRLVAKQLARPAVAAWLIARAQRTPYLHIMRHDEDRDLHDHPWNARTVILRGSYTEERLEPAGIADIAKPGPLTLMWVEELDDLFKVSMKTRNPGDTARLNHGEYHRIDQISTGGVYTLFITSKWRGDWGFLVNGVKVPWRTYTGCDN
jgi:hypothetical protein